MALLRTTNIHDPLHAGSFPDLYSLFLRGELTDLTVIVRGTQIKLHKIVLAAKSPVFRAMLETGMSEGLTNTIRIDDVEPDVFREVVTYLYRGDSPNLTSLHAEMLQVADKYGLSGLLSTCEMIALQCLNSDNAVQYLVIADMHSRDAMKMKVIEMIRPQLRRMITQGDWPMVSFQLKTELARRFAIDQLPRHEIENTTLTYNDDRRNDDRLITWRIKSTLFFSGRPLVSPSFRIMMSDKTLRFCFLFRRSDHTCYVQIMVLSETKVPLSLQGVFSLIGANPDPIFLNQTINWSHHDIDHPRPKNALPVFLSDSILIALPNEVKFSLLLNPTERFKLPQGQVVWQARRYFNSPRFSDVTLHVEGEVFYGHRLLLASLSPFFARLLDFEPEPEDLRLSGMSAKDLNIILSYLYAHDLPDPFGLGFVSIDIKTLEVVRMCDLDDLFDHCETQMLKRPVVMETAVQNFIDCDRLRAMRLKEQLKWFIVRNIETMPTHESWELLASKPHLIDEILVTIAAFQHNSN